MNVLALFLTLFLTVPVFGAGFQFPSPRSSQSPDGRWKLSCETSEAQPDGLRHSIVLTDSHGGVFKLLRFGRHCDVRWSRDSSRIALTDWSGSDISDILICSATNSVALTSLRDLCVRSRTSISSKELSGHSYFEASKCLNGHRLRFKVSGHTNEKVSRSFKHQYVFDAARGLLEN
jgi:hypothetical protein